MDPVRWEERPRLDRPVLVAAFEGWNDAGDAASTAARYLAASWNARRVATIDPEEFYDFTTNRPRIRLRDGVKRRLEWPEGELSVATGPDAPRDVVFLQAAEPHLRWRTYTEAVVEVARSLDVALVVTMGALLADIPHTRPVRVTGTTGDLELAERLGLEQSLYEGPTGIVGVLHEALSRAGIQSLSLWATVPHYLSATPSPRAALALVERMATLFGTATVTLELQVAAASYDRQVNELVEEDDDLAAYVRQLEESGEDGAPGIEGGGEMAWPPPTGSLAAEAERFLRERPPD